MVYSCFDWGPSTFTTAERILTDVLGASARLGDPEPQWDGADNCKRNVLRCRVESGCSGAPQTVILKRIASPKTPYDPNDFQCGTIAWRHGSEWAACRFLAGLDAGHRLAPRCYGADRMEALLVLEDIGKGPAVADVLRGSDPVRAEGALLSYADSLGRLHAETLGREGSYNKVRNEIELPLVPLRFDDLYHIREHIEKVRAILGALGFDFTESTMTELEGVLETVRDPGPFLVLTHGDPNPVNDLIHGDNVHLYDFEYSGYRHALMDGVYNGHLYPWTRYRLPANVLALVEARYRARLADTCPEANDEERFRREQIGMRAVWMLVTLRGLLERARAQDRYEDDGYENVPGVTPTLRQRALILFNRFAEDSEAYACLPLLGTAAREIGTLLQTEWQVEPLLLPLYPAFRDRYSS